MLPKNKPENNRNECHNVHHSVCTLFLSRGFRMKNPIGKVNEHDTRESWLRAATNLLRDHFAVSGYPLPEKIRFAIAFPSTGRHGSRVGECWHSSTSADGHFEIIIRADLADPIEVLGTLSYELVHAVLPADAGHETLP